MIGFFRKIRRKLANQNKFLQYGRYAIGEIVLVMAGILLALQVNNWNEDRNMKTREISLLKEMAFNLESDLASVKYDFEQHTQALVSCKVILKIFAENGQYNDSLQSHFAAINNYTVFSFNQGAYQSFKSVGIESITNRALSSNIVSLYDQWYGVYIQNQSNLMNDILFKKRDFYEDKFSKFHVFTVNEDDFKYFGKMKPNNFEELKKDIKFNYWLNSLEKSHEQLLYIIRYITNEIMTLKKQIQTEVEILN